MNQKSITHYKKHSRAFVMATGVCFAFLTLGLQAAHAEEDVAEVDVAEATTVEQTATKANTPDADKRSAMLKQIESLRAAIAERTQKVQDKQQMRVEAKVDMKAEKKAEAKLDKAAFMSTLEGMDEASKRTAMMDFIAEIKSAIAAKQAVMAGETAAKKEMNAEKKVENTADRNEFKSSLDGLSHEAKLAAIMKRVTELQQQIKAKETAAMSVEVESDAAEVDADESEATTE